MNALRSAPAAALVALIVAAAARADVALERRDADGRVDVSIDGQPFTSYVFAGHKKPILYPVLGPGGVPMTRSWPVEKDVAGEAHDHPHHESVWFTHGKVNGVDFWLHRPAKGETATPRVEHVAFKACEGGRDGVIETENRWVAADGTVVCTDTRRIVFGGTPAARTIDYTVTLRADHGAVTLGDTKEGTMALRVRTPLQLKEIDGSKGAAGHCVNSEGQRDADAWGKAARWVGYWGTVEGKDVGISILDHPKNLRHPAHWHARDYGLFAANPFGLHDFTGAPPGSGDHVIPDGGTLTLRYLLVFHEGDAEAAGIEPRWRAWSADPAKDTP
jgi:hypothetical protein